MSSQAITGTEFRITLESASLAAEVSAGVDSFNGRTEVVLPASDDYLASQITNDSSIVGAYVSDALDTLSSDTTDNFLSKTTTDQQGVEGEVQFMSEVVFNPSAITIGNNGLKLSAGSRILSYKDVFTDEAITAFQRVDDSGSSRIFSFDMGEAFTAPVADVADTMLPSPQFMQFLSPITTYTSASIFIPAEVGEVTIKVYAGTTVNDPVVSERTITIEAGDVGVPFTFVRPNSVLSFPLDQQLVEFSGARLMGGLQTSGSFVGQVTPFYSVTLQLVDSYEVAVLGDDISLFTNDASYIDAAGAPIQTVNGLTGNVVLDTDDVHEGLNKYYSSSLFNTDFSSKTTTDLSEGTHLYYTQARFDSAFSAKDTTSLSEGTNLYYTEARVNANSLVAGAEQTANKGMANGYAELDGSGKVPVDQIPLTTIIFKGTFGSAGSTTGGDLPTSGVIRGDLYICDINGYVSVVAGDTFNIGDWALYDGATWSRIPSTAAVLSVNSQTGVVTLDTDDIPEGLNKYYSTTLFNVDFGSKSTTDLPEGANSYYTEARVSANSSVTANTNHRSNTSNPHSVTQTQVGLGNVDNTSDLDKPISNAQAIKNTEYETDIGQLETDLTNHENNTSNPHNVTQLQVGLSNVDNTSDLNKPISVATQTALDGKKDDFTENTAFNKDFGSGAATVCEGNDARLSDARVPLAHTQTASTITDFDTAVSANTSVVANTAKVSFPEAPNDGQDYVRKNEAWAVADGVGYILATWGANLQTVGRHPAINSPSNSAQITSLGIEASMPVPAAGTIDTITYYNATGDNTTEFQIIKNGVVVHTFTCVGPYGAETGINVPTGFVGSVPDNIAIRYSAGTAPSEGLYTAYVK